MFLAQCPIRTRAGPNRLPTLPTLMPATCSTKWRRGRHAPERARHGRRASKLCATRRLAPCCSKTERLCVSLPPSLTSAHPGALPPRAHTPERGRHGCRCRARCCRRCCGPSASRCPATHLLLSTALSLALRAPPRPFFAVEAPSPPEQPPTLRLLAWPGQLGPPRAEPSCPLGARGPADAPPPLHHRRRASFGRQQQVRHAPLLLIPTRGLGLKFDKMEGSNCEVCDSNE